MTRVRAIEVVFLVVVGMGSYALYDAYGAQATCEPSYRRVGRLSVHEGKVKGTWILVGCRADLDRLDAGQMERAKAPLAAVLKNKLWSLDALDTDLRWRKEVTASVNKVIGDALVADVILAEHEVWE